jgi:hypothetical protein
VYDNPPPRRDLRVILLQLNRAMERLEQATASPSRDELNYQGRLLNSVAELRESLDLLMEALPSGQCERARPFSPLHTIMNEQGLFVCCNHKPQHCEPLR